MIKKDRIQSYPYNFLIKIDQCAVFCNLFSRHFSQRLVGDVNG